LTEREVKRIAPNLNLFLWRPVLAELCSYTELKTTITLAELYDMHEALDLKGAQAEKAERAG
jgi:hypothetical protein